MDNYHRVRERLRKQHLGLPALEQLPGAMHSHQLMFNYIIEGPQASELVKLLGLARAVKQQLELEDVTLYSDALKTVKDVEKLLLEFFGKELPTLLLFKEALKEIERTRLVNPASHFAYAQDFSSVVEALGTESYPIALKTMFTTAFDYLSVHTDEELAPREGDVRGIEAKLEVHRLLRSIELEEAG